ncbi:MAG TPA: hypothetical protein VEQ84_07305 [Vicinamibacteria bacterium]|nr:hypothetical protein [Vicinamibacteria bacterium]
MRGRVLAVAALIAALAFYLLREAGGPGPSPGGPDASRATPPVTLVGDASAAPSPPLRNVFEYVSAASRPAAPTRSLAAVAPVAPAALASPPGPPPLRLVGLLRRGAQVKAALAIMGETVVLAAGESAGGYTVLAIDDDEGVRVRTPDGGTIVLVPTSDR